VLGENVAATPGKVICRTDLFELIHYTPVSESVLAVPLLIFPPWINRFYILDLNPKKSFVKWAVDQGLSVIVVSWRSADESMADVGWDDYVRAQVEAIDLVRDRLQVPAVTPSAIALPAPRWPPPWPCWPAADRRTRWPAQRS
jgi:polyhydroxyalkanoate synthase subunit PhaC